MPEVLLVFSSVTLEGKNTCTVAAVGNTETFKISHTRVLILLDSAILLTRTQSIGETLPCKSSTIFAAQIAAIFVPFFRTAQTLTNIGVTSARKNVST